MVVQLFGARDRELAQQLVQAHGLRFETNYDALFGFYQGRELVATAARDGNIFKMFVIAAEHQGGGLLGELISELLRSGFEAGFSSFFVFTPPASASSFRAFNFTPLVNHHQVCLLEFGNGLQRYLQAHRPPVRAGNNGAVVVNCNPFTRGHQYLIEQAAAQVDQLYVFIVREDRSFFPFEIRFRLVEQGLAHLANVTILDSADYAVSSVTFPSYFLKEDDDVQSLQMELDLILFAKHLAPFFHIKSRFIGTEPYCRTTRIYSETMKYILEPFGVRTVQLERCQQDGEAVSAFRVRQAWRNQAYESLRRLVPPTTLAFLQSGEGQKLQRKLAEYQRRH